MSKIRIKVEQYDDEPAWSVLHRLARLAGTASARDFCLDFSLDKLDIENATELQIFARRGGYDLEKLERNSVRLEGTHYEFGGERILYASVFSGVNRICTSCIHADVEHLEGRPRLRAHWRDWWFIKGIGACPFHKVRLTCTDIVSGRSRIPEGLLDPFQGLPEGFREIPVENVAAESYLLGRLGFMHADPHWLLDRIPLGNAITALRNVGMAVIHGVAPDRKGEDEEDDRNAVMAAGFEVLRSRSSLDAFLDGLFAIADPPKGNWGPRVVYGRLYDWLKAEQKETSTGAMFDRFRQVVLEHALRTFPVNPVEEFFGERIPTRNLYTLHHLWKLTGIHTTRLRSILVKAGVIEEKTAELEGWRIFVTAADAGKLFDRLKGQMTRIEMCTRYGIPRGTFEVLQKEGVVQAWIQTGDAGEGRQTWLTADMNEWFSQLITDAPEIEYVRPGACSLSAASSLSRTPIDLIVRALLDGRLKACGVLSGEKPWDSVLVMVEEIRELFDEKEADGLLGWDEAIARLRSTHAMLTALVEQGHLAFRILKGKTGRQKKCFDPVALEAFDATYLSMKEAASHVGSHSRVLRMRLAEAGIEPAFDLGISPAAAFYRRIEVEAFEEGAFRSLRSAGRMGKAMA